MIGGWGWKARLMEDPAGLFGGKPRASAMGVRVTSLGVREGRIVAVGAAVLLRAREADRG